MSAVRYSPRRSTFTQGYEKMGIIRKDGKTVYREWAPGATAAQIIGDFNGWHGTWMERDEFGTFSVTLPDGERALQVGCSVWWWWDSHD